MRVEDGRVTVRQPIAAKSLVHWLSLAHEEVLKSGESFVITCYNLKWDLEEEPDILYSTASITDTTYWIDMLSKCCRKPRARRKGGGKQRRGRGAAMDVDAPDGDGVGSDAEAAAYMEEHDALEKGDVELNEECYGGEDDDPEGEGDEVHAEHDRALVADVVARWPGGEEDPNLHGDAIHDDVDFDDAVLQADLDWQLDAEDPGNEPERPAPLPPPPDPTLPPPLDPPHHGTYARWRESLVPILKPFENHMPVDEPETNTLSIIRQEVVGGWRLQLVFWDDAPGKVARIMGIPARHARVPFMPKNAREAIAGDWSLVVSKVHVRFSRPRDDRDLWPTEMSDIVDAVRGICCEWRHALCMVCKSNPIVMRCTVCGSAIHDVCCGDAAAPEWEGARTTLCETVPSARAILLFLTDTVTDDGSLCALCRRLIEPADL